MRNECNIIRDILPLYIEDMVSGDTADFVESHLKQCGACRAKLEKLKTPGEPPVAADTQQDRDEAPLRSFQKRWSKRNRLTIGITAFITAFAVLFAAYFFGSGFLKRTDAALAEYSVSDDGTTLTFHVIVPSSMGYIRGFKDSGGGVKPHYLTFYSAFGGLNGSLCEKSEFELALDETDTEIFFNRTGGGYELVLLKNTETGEWLRASESDPPDGSDAS